MHYAASETCYNTFVSNVIKCVIWEYKLPSYNSQIVFDNGVESNGYTNILLAQYPKITKIIAKLETPHVNNIVEEAYKRYKIETLPVKHFETFEDLVSN